MLETTFLPKTSGLVFSDRLQARSDKGRVFLSGAVTYDPLVVVAGAKWKDDNIYEIGQTIQGQSATYSGGSENTVYRSRYSSPSAGHGRRCCQTAPTRRPRAR